MHRSAGLYSLVRLQQLHGRCLAGCADEMRWSAGGSWVTGAKGVHALDSGSGAKWGRSGLGSLDPCLAADANADATRIEETGRYDASGGPRRTPTLQLCIVPASI